MTLTNGQLIAITIFSVFRIVVEITIAYTVHKEKKNKKRGVKK